MNGLITVLGAGHAGRALAGDLARQGADVILWNRTPDHVAEIADAGGVELEGEVSGFGKLRLVTSDIAEALADATLEPNVADPRSPPNSQQSHCLGGISIGVNHVGDAQLQAGG